MRYFQSLVKSKLQSQKGDKVRRQKKIQCKRGKGEERRVYQSGKERRFVTVQKKDTCKSDRIQYAE